MAPVDEMRARRILKKCNFHSKKPLLLDYRASRSPPVDSNDYENFDLLNKGHATVVCGISDSYRSNRRRPSKKNFKKGAPQFLKQGVLGIGLTGSPPVAFNGHAKP